ncbi:hypothetical protein N7517_011211 [Penicillium concentricum]|uniref:Uncharacterized protein n=1 Tax=Penicillium concentricum TaxID=293559 RepID=A0A9W9RAG4_9EURO|nr:uncharacterized protein N7517_011211 [Penicillium concentricum]KAJ5356602.1 hypothetical protein N7517_011211 [Penicillium concentricum]
MVLVGDGDQYQRKIKQGAERPQTAGNTKPQQGDNFQSQAPRKLRMTEGLMQYFMENFEIDTTRENLKALGNGGTMVAEL